MGDFNPLYTQIYYVFLYLFNTWEYMGYYGIYWVNTSAYCVLPVHICILLNTRYLTRKRIWGIMVA
mgnify:CR=1 FL=1